MTEERAATWALVITLGLLAVRLAIADRVGLGDVEAYYWTWSRHPDLSYFDHPPMVAWMIALTTRLGGDSPLFVRLGPILLCAATSCIVYLLAVALSSRRVVGLYALCLFQITPAFSVGGQGANPDVPLGFFWALFLWLLWEATTGNRRALMLAAGGALGCALLAKYFAVLLFAVAGLWLARPENRHWLRRWQLYGALILAAAIASPIGVWGFAHDFASVRYHLGRHSAAGFTLRQAAMFLGGQALYYSPLLWLGYLWSLVLATREARGDDDTGRRRACAFLATAALPPLAFFTFVGFWTPESEPHWTAMGYLPLCVAAALLLPERIALGSRGLRVAAKVAVWLPVALLVAVHLHLLTALFLPLIAERHRPLDIAGETYGWPTVGQRAEEIAAGMEHPLIVHYHYTKAAQLAYAVRYRLPVVCLNDRFDQFDFWQDEPSLVGRDMLYVTDSVYWRPPDEVWRFDRIDEETPLEIRRDGLLVRTFRFWRCHGYRGPAAGRASL